MTLWFPCSALNVKVVQNKRGWTARAKSPNFCWRSRLARMHHEQGFRWWWFHVCCLSCRAVPVRGTHLRAARSSSTSWSSSGRASLVSSVKTYLTCLPSQGRQLRTGKSDVYQQPIAGTMCLFLCHTPTQDQPLVRRDEEVLDALGGHHLRMGGAQEEEGWRRRAL